MSDVILPQGLFRVAGSPVANVATTAAPVVAETAKTGLFGFDPASIAFSLFVNSILGNRGTLKPTPMTPEELAKYQGETGLDQAVAQFAQGGEGTGEMVLEAIRRAEAANVPAEDIAETLNSRGNVVADLIGMTVGSNQPFTAETIADLTEDTTASDLEAAEAAEALESATPTVGTTADANVAQNGSTDVSGGVVDDAQETWTYNAATDSFISNTRGDSIPRSGDPDVALKDGGEYAVRPVIGTEGVTAEHVVEADTGKTVGAFTVDVLTGMPTLNKLPDVLDTDDEAGTTDTTDTDVNGAASVGPAAPTVVDGSGGTQNGTISVSGGTLGGTYTGVARNGGGTLDLNVATNGTDGIDGKDGVDGTDGRDGRDGRDGLTGLLTLNTIATPLADEIFTSEFKMDYLKPEFIGLLDLTRGRTV